MKYTLEKGKRYGAELKLEGFDELATNDYIKEYLEDYGFTNVVVRGDGVQRSVAATWVKDSVTGNLPPQVDYVEEIDV